MEALIQYFLLYFALVAVAAAALIGLVRYRKLGLTQRYLLALTLLALAMEIVTRLLTYHKQSNLFLAPIDAVLEFVVLGLIYRRELRPTRISRLIPLLIIGFVLGTALSYTSQPDTPQFSPVQHFIESVLVLAFVGVIFIAKSIGRFYSTPRARAHFLGFDGLAAVFPQQHVHFLVQQLRAGPVQGAELARMVHSRAAVHFLNVLYIVALWLPERQRAYLEPLG